MISIGFVIGFVIGFPWISEDSKDSTRILIRFRFDFDLILA